MRRKDREITDDMKIDQIIRSCHCCRLGLCDGDDIYIVPLSFGYVQEDGKRVFYFHSAGEGRKLDLIRCTGRAGFEMDTNYQLREADTACEYSAGFQSVIGTGKVSVVTEPEAREKALQEIMYHNTGRSGWTFQSEMLTAVCVIRLEVEKLSCKEHL